MNAVGHLRCTFWSAGLCALASSAPAATPVFPDQPLIPDQRDGQVLEALLLHLLADPGFDRTRISTNGASIVLHARSPHSVVAPDDTDDGSLLDEAASSLRERNALPGAKDRYKILAKVLSGTAYYTNLTFAAGIVVADLTPTLTGQRRAFKEAHPKARGWVAASLPGYSKDGTRAIVSGGVGPSARGAAFAALLEKSGEKWVVKWYHIKLPALYAQSPDAGDQE